MKQYWIVYLTINIKNNKIYIGVHKTSDPNNFDGYLGCGVDIHDSNSIKNPKTHFQCAVKKYGFKNFRRFNLAVFDNENDAYNLEHKIVNIDFLKRTDVYNMDLGGRFTPKLNAKKVYMYDLNGNFEMEFQSRSDAARFLTGRQRPASAIAKAINCHQFYHGHQFSDVKLPCMKDFETLSKDRKKRVVNTIKDKYTSGIILNFTKPRKVGQYDMDGNLIKEWDSLRQCIKVGKFTNAQGVLNGQRSHCKGFVFKYIEE